MACASILLCQAAAEAQDAADAAHPVVVDLRIDQAISSRTSKIGDMFRLSLVHPVLSAAGAVLIPAGVQGQGEVIHAARAGGAGRAGELIVTARFLQCDGARVTLGHFHLTAAGRDATTGVGAASAAMAGGAVFAPLAGAGTLLAFAIKGGEVVIPAGTSATAAVTDPSVLPARAAPCARAARVSTGGEG